MPRTLIVPLLAFAVHFVVTTGANRVRAAEPAAPRPTMAEFIGVNGHTVQFKPELYAKVCRKVRDYHPYDWDVGKETDFLLRFPEAQNRVNWNEVYGSWQKAGFETDVCVMFDTTPPKNWKNLPRDAQTYGKSFAKAFGPSSEKKLVSSIEIGNEPGKYNDQEYHDLLKAAATGVREGDRKLKIATCNITVGKSGQYDKSVDCLKGLDSLYDVLNIHKYAMAEGWPTWRRSYPEDPKIDFLKSIEGLIAWRNANAKGKEIWVTEFGWDASTQPLAKTGDAAKWNGNVSDEKQAQYLVRSFLLFSGMDVRRAYLYFFNDSNEPSFHASSGITRNFQPKPSFYAVGHLYRTLGDYRFSQALVKKGGDAYIYEFVNAKSPQKTILVAWSPTGTGRKAEIELPIGKAQITRVEKMALAEAGSPQLLNLPARAPFRFTIDESPTYFWVEN